MISSITLQNLRNPEFLQLVKDTLSIVAFNGLEALQITDQYNALQVAQISLETLFMADRSNPISKELLGMDSRRDNAINGIIAQALTATYHFDDTIQIAGTVINEYLSSYGPGIAKANYPTKTAILSNIVADFTNKPQLAAAVATLQLNDWVTEMDTANNIFNQNYLLRTQAYGAANTDTMKAKRLEAANDYYDLRDNLNAFFTINKAKDPFGKTVNELNALIAQYNHLLVSRGSKTPVITVANEGTVIN